MLTVGQIERKIQQRVVWPFREQLGYAYPGDWTDREGNANIEQELLRAWLTKRGVNDAQVNKRPLPRDETRALYSHNAYRIESAAI